MTFTYNWLSSVNALRGVLLPLALFMSSGALIGAVSQPADYGFTYPTPEPTLPSNFDTFSPPRYGVPEGPAIGEWTHTAGPNETITFAGPDFTAESTFRIYKQSTATNAQLSQRKVNTASGSGATLTLPSGLGSWATYFVWPSTAAKLGLPVAVNRTEAWWLGPNEAVAGEKTAIYGRNLARNNGVVESYIYIKPAAGAGQWVPATSVNPYRVEFLIPNLTPGDYEVWSHNGHAGRFGWSGPKTLTVLAVSPFAGQSSTTINVRDYGAKGDNATDDTIAIQAALKAAQAKSPSTLYFPEGIYIANSAFMPPPDVTWRGDGADRSTIKVGGNFSSVSDPGFIVSHIGPGRVEFKALCIDNNGNLGSKHLISLRQHRYLRFTDVKLVAGNSTLDLHDNQNMVLKGCTIIGGGAFLGNSRQVSIETSTFRMTNYASFALASWAGEEVAIVNNIAKDDDASGTTAAGSGNGRFFVSQGHFGSLRNIYIGQNQTINFAPPQLPGVDTNQGEQILFEMQLLKMSAAPSAVGASSVTFAQPTPYLGLDAIIVKGRGVGQTRKIVAASGNTIELSSPFRVLPDQSSSITIAPAQSQTVVYQNKLDGKDGYADAYSASVGVNLWGTAYNNIVANNTMTRMRGGISVEWMWKDQDGVEVPNGGGIYFNLIASNSLDGSLYGFGGFTLIQQVSAPLTIGHFGNTYRSNNLRNVASTAIDIALGPKFASGTEGGDFSHIVFELNTFSGEEPEVRVLGDNVANSLNLFNNTFQRVGSARPGNALDIDSAAGNPLFLSGNQWMNFGTFPYTVNLVPDSFVLGAPSLVTIARVR